MARTSSGKVLDNPATTAAETDRPNHLGELCERGCGADENGGGIPHPTATSFGCEHGSWSFPQAPVVDVFESLDLKPRQVIEDQQWLVEQMKAAGATDDVIAKVLASAAAPAETA